MALCLFSAMPVHADPATEERVVVDLAGTNHGQAFRPDEVFGAAIDGAERDQVDRTLTSANIAKMKSAGLRPLTYRLRTELGIAVWHWNPVGQWSDAAHEQGYWTSSDKLGAPIKLSWGYRLPRRGDTVDNATDDDYSRLTDGDRETFWKSNPYLDPTALRDNADHPQWLVLRFDKPRPIDTAVIDWGMPFAVEYEVQYWKGNSEYDRNGSWVTFPHGQVNRGDGGQVTLQLADQPIITSHVRVLLHTASGTAPEGASDWRDRLGYAVREVSFGLRRPDGSLEDAVVHAKSRDRQTFAHVSSTDPWHRAEDRNPDIEQPGIDHIFTSKLGFGLPVMLPTGLLFDTPDNVAAELRYVARRGYPVTQVELGEEPDGQYGVPADYGALFLATLDRVKGELPGAHFGGPSLQSAFTDLWMPQKPGSWNAGFVDYLKQRGRLGDLGFVSFEYYPFDDICGDIHAKLIQQSTLLDEAARRLDADGLPRAVPRIITEYGFSAYSGRAMVEMPSALLMAGVVGQWLSLGGRAAYMFGYGPNVPINQHQACAGYGNMMLFTADEQGRAAQPMPSYHAARLLTQIWTIPGHRLHQSLEANVEGDATPDVVVYAIERPDHRVGAMLINRSPVRRHILLLASNDPTRRFTGMADIYSYGPEQYAWLDAGAQSHVERDLPPMHDKRSVATGLTLDPSSIVIAVAKTARAPIRH